MNSNTVYPKVCSKFHSQVVSGFCTVSSSFVPVLFRFSGFVPLLFRFCSAFVPVLFRFCSGFVPLLFRFCSGFVPVFQFGSGFACRCVICMLSLKCHDSVESDMSSYSAGFRAWFMQCPQTSIYHACMLLVRCAFCRWWEPLIAPWMVFLLPCTPDHLWADRWPFSRRSRREFLLLISMHVICQMHACLMQVLYNRA